MDHIQIHSAVIDISSKQALINFLADMPERKRRFRVHKQYRAVTAAIEDQLPHDEYKKFAVPYTKQQIEDTFKSYDQNGDGKLSWDEVKAAFTKLGAFSPYFRAWRGKSRADANDDGFICLQTELDELVNYTLELQYKP
ncbi:hypothetical protein ACLB2K_009795 [Fragaria x ananassa]